MKNVGRLLAAACHFAASSLLAAASNEFPQLFQHPPDDARIMMRWWWFGPAVEKERLLRELELMKAGGIGGVEVQPVYPLALDDPESGFRNLPFLSEGFGLHLRHAAQAARSLGLRWDLTLGSGWPFGGPEIPVTLAAGRLRHVVQKKRPFVVPDIGHGERLIAVFAAEPGAALRQVSAAAIPPGAAEVHYFIASRTGQMVKRAAVGAEGFVLDHYDRKALETYLERTGARLMSAVSDSKPQAIFCDSLEVFGSDWTGDLPGEFRRRRGYDLIEHLPKLVGQEESPEARAIRHDWGLTLSELAEERFIQPMQEFARRHGVEFRIQGYGIPPVTLSTNRLADLPEGEGWQWKELRASRWASSAAHLYGKRAVSSETWTWLRSPSFAATPLDMKAEADRHFLQGITQLIGHGWPYTAEGVAYPGWRFYAAAVFNEKNPWWLVMPDVARYLQRVSYALRQGRPANTIALYLPNHDAWGDFRTGHVHMIEALKQRLGPSIIPAILEAGYGFDFFDDAAADRLTGGGYRIAILPAVERMPIETLRKLKEFAERGGAVLASGRLPEGAPGYLATARDHAAVQRLAGSFVRLAPPAGEPGFVEALRRLAPPELEMQPAMAEIGFLRRKLSGGDLYFIANTGNRPVAGRIAPVSEHRAGQWLDPMTGEREDAGTAPFSLSLAPYESRILWLTGVRSAARRAMQPAAKPRLLDSGWTLRVPGRSAPLRVGAPRPWTDEPELKYFSGVAEYETTLVLAAAPGAAQLDFGDGQAMEDMGRGPGMRALLEPPVHEAAEVWVNGQRAGSIWAPPYRLEIGRLLRAGENRIRLLVANTAINHMAGHPLPDYRLLNSRFGTRFEPQDMDQVKPAVSGLTCPPRLTFMRSQQ